MKPKANEPATEDLKGSAQGETADTRHSQRKTGNAIRYAAVRTRVIVIRAGITQVIKNASDGKQAAYQVRYKLVAYGSCSFVLDWFYSS
jgi:hypothetical protein